jgi:hypothetical protein
MGCVVNGVRPKDNCATIKDKEPDLFDSTCQLHGSIIALLSKRARDRGRVLCWDSLFPFARALLQPTGSSSVQVDHKHVTVDLIDYWWGGIVPSNRNAAASGPLHDGPTHDRLERHDSGCRLARRTG